MRGCPSQVPNSKGLFMADRSKARSIYRILVLLSVTVTASGCIVRPAARSIVSIRRADGVGQPIEAGLRDAYWVEDSEGVHIAASGWHYREHETYAFFISEPEPVPFRRTILLNPIDGDSEPSRFEVRAMLDGRLIPCGTETEFDEFTMYQYRGETAARVAAFLGSRTVKISDIELFPEDTSMPVLIVDGKLIAESDDEGKYQRIREMSERFSEDIGTSTDDQDETMPESEPNQL